MRGARITSRALIHPMKGFHMKLPHRYAFAALAAIIALITLPAHLLAHGFSGDRFFPPTITTDDPFAADELALPTISYFKNPSGDGSPSSHETDASFEFDKLIIPHLSIGLSDTASWFHPTSTPPNPSQGVQNLTLNVKYELLNIPAHEFILSLGLEADVGGTGSKSIDRDSFTTFTPTLYFGKGFGDLPTSLNALRPLALTGTLGEELPTRAQAPNALDWGLALQYQLPYLQQHVANIGLPEPFKNMIPLLEFDATTTQNRGPSTTTGTLNPGILYETKYFQIGVEALIPINRDSGDNVGAVVQIWWFLDDLAPKFFGKPLFGGNE
jgi:hypothetical protein